MPSIHEWIECRTGDGTPLPVEACNHYRNIKGLPAIESSLAPGGSPRFSGLGDVVAAVTHATGIDRVVKAVTGGNCGCKERQQQLNEMFPFKGAGE